MTSRDERQSWAELMQEEKTADFIGAVLGLIVVAIVVAVIGWMGYDITQISS